MLRSHKNKIEKLINMQILIYNINNIMIIEFFIYFTFITDLIIPCGITYSIQVYSALPAAIPAIPLIALLCEKKRLEILAQRLAGMPIPTRCGLGTYEYLVFLFVLKSTI